MITSPLEPHTRTKIDLRLKNLGWELDATKPDYNVTQGQTRTPTQKKLLKGKMPDYVLYESGTDVPIGVIEAKRPGKSLDAAMDQCIKRYAEPLKATLAFAFNDTFVYAKHVGQNRVLKIDGEEVLDFIDQLTALRFIYEGAEILSIPKGIKFSRNELISIFKDVNNLLRKEGLRFGYERFSAFAEILFLKLIDEYERLDEAKGIKRRFEEKFCWSHFTKLKRGGDLLDFLKDSVWKRLQIEYGDIFETFLSIKNGSTLDEIIEKIEPINLTATETDIKGDAFEYFLKSVTNGTKDLGEYFTPRHIVKTMVNLVKPVYGEKIYDPFCGTGGFLIEAFKYLSLRTDISKAEILEEIRKNTIFGREITSTARIAKMNMVLFGDGHTNIEQIDSLKNPVEEKYEVVLSNIPYSQETEYGAKYNIPTKDGNSVCVQHIWKALKPNGRAAIIVPETFLYKGGVIGQTRELIAKNAESFSVISLPRGVFMPYTPTKTNIIYFKKGGQFKRAYFFVIFNDGFELNTKRKTIKGNSDIKELLSSYDEKEIIKGQATIVNRQEIIESGNWNLRPFYYMEDIPNLDVELIKLSKDIIEERAEKVDPRKYPDDDWHILEVSQNGVFLSDTLKGSEFTQEYKKVYSGDLAYNPYRVNIGSIAVIPSYYNEMLVSPAYIVFKIKDKKFPPMFILSILKNPCYRRIIMNYSLGSARANLPYEELTRIYIPKIHEEESKYFNKFDKKLDKELMKVNEMRTQIINYANNYFKKKKLNKQIKKNDENPNHRKDFNKLIRKASSGYLKE
jgi:type I restriction enzyme M protein